MDLLFSKYASPFSLLDSMIQNKRFFEFVLEFMKIHNENLEWEFYLHKAVKGSFEEFKKSIEEDESNEKMTDEQIEATLIESKNILNEFKPT